MLNDEQKKVLAKYGIDLTKTKKHYFSLREMTFGNLCDFIEGKKHLSRDARVYTKNDCLVIEEPSLEKDETTITKITTQLYDRKYRLETEISYLAKDLSNLEKVIDTVNENE